MSKTGCIISHEGIEYLCGLINKIVSSPKELLDDINLATNTTFSSVRIDSLISDTLQQANTHAEALYNALTKLTAQKTTVQPTLDNSELNVIYLFSSDGNAPFQQYLKISDTELIDMGSTTISLNDYLTITDAVATYAKLSDFNTLTTEVTNIKTDIGTEDISGVGTSVKNAINKLNNKSNILTVTQAEYNNLVTGQTITIDGKDYKYSDSTYYIISDDSENIEITQSISSSSTENEVPSAKAVYDKTKNMCTTTVADVGKTNITSRVSNVTVNAGGGVYYSIKNGICYVQIHSVVTTVASSGQKILSDDSLPIPDYNLTNGHYAIVSPQSTNGLIVLDENGAVYYYGGEMTIFTSISYPVIES